MSCRSMRERLGARIDGRLGGAEADALRAHLAGCAGCRRDLARWEAAALALRASGPTAVPADLAERAFRAAIAPREAPAAAEEWFLRAARRTLLAGAAAAAAIWIGVLAAGARAPEADGAAPQDGLELAVLLWTAEGATDGE